jgi:transcriptional regulator with XRE-family HTH domain
MFNIVFSEEYTCAPTLLVELRRRAGLSQRDLGRILDRSQSHIHRMETGQRPIELVEFCRIARAAKVDPAQALASFLDAWAGLGLDYPRRLENCPRQGSRAA